MQKIIKKCDLCVGTHKMVCKTCGGIGDSKPPIFFTNINGVVMQKGGYCTSCKGEGKVPCVRCDTKKLAPKKIEPKKQ